MTPEAMTPETAERALLDWYARADSNIRRRGRHWYPTMRAILERTAAEYGYTLEQAVAVLAITSPGAQLVTNLRWTERALATDGNEPVGRFPNRVGPKIRAVLADPDLAHAQVTGPKVAPFYRAILGDTGALALDRWAAYAAGHAERDADIPAEHRRTIEQAYRSAARKVRRTVRDFQATIWIAARELTDHNGHGHPVRYADITA